MRRAWLLAACVMALLAAPAPRAAADPARLSARLASAGFENVGVAGDSSGCRVRLESRRFRDPNFAFGVIGALAAAECPGACEVVLLREGLPVARVRFRTSDIQDLAAGRIEPAALGERLRVELLPDAPPEVAAPLAPAARRLDLSPRVLIDTEFGHIERPVNYHLEVAAEASTQPWRGAFLRVGYTFPVRHGADIPPSENVPDYDHARPEEAALYQFFRLPHRILGSASAGFFGADRYGVSVGLGMVAGRRWYFDAAADASGSLSFFPDVHYSDMTRVTFQGSVTFRPPLDQDLSLGIRAGRYLYGNTGDSQGEYAIRGFASRRFHQVELGGFIVKSKYDKFGGLTLAVPIPPQVRAMPAAVRLNLPEVFPVEYRTDEGVVEKLPIDWRLRAALLDDLWPGSVGAQLDSWRDGAQWAAEHAGEASR